MLYAVCLLTLGADCGGGLPPSLNPSTCPPPTIDQCQKPMTECDRYFRDQGKSDADSPCSLLLSQAAVSAAGGYPEKTVLTPKTYGPGLASYKSDGGTTRVHAVPEDSDLTMTGLTSLGFGRRLDRALRIRGLSSPLLALAARQEMIDELETYKNGGQPNVVESCEEYAFEKYFDAAAWDAQVMIANAYSDHRKAFDIAYGPASERTSIGTRHLNDPAIRSRDGTPSGATVPFELDRPKNDYFRVPHGWGTGSKVRFMKGATDSVGQGPLGELLVTLKDLDRSGLSLNGVIFDDQALENTIKAGERFYDESFAWHQLMSIRNAGVLDEQLLLEHERRDAFLNLIASRDEVARQLAEYASGSHPPPVAGGNRFTERWWLDPLWNPDPTAVTSIQSLTFELTQVPSFNVSPGSIVTYSNQVQPSKETLAPSALATLSAGPNLQKPCNGTGNPFFCLAYRLAEIDKAIEDELHAAQSRDCLSLATSGRAPCDWSPRDFTQRVLGFADEDREAAFRKCDESVDSFIDLRSRALIQDRADGGVGVNYPAQDYTTSTTALDLYLTRQDQYLDVLGEVVGPLLERKTVNGTNKLRLARSEGEQKQMGDKWFGAKLYYSLGFSMDGLPAEPVPPGTVLDDCVIKTRADATFGLVATVLTADIELVTAQVHAQDEFFEAHVKVLDQKWDKSLPLMNGTVPVFTDSQMAYQTFLEGSSTFAIGYILVSVGAAVSGGVGYGVDVEVGRDTVTSGGCQVSRIGVYPTIVPLTFVEGSAYAAVEAIVARVGIKGHLTLASVSVPIAGEVSIGPTMSDPTILDARFKLGASLRLHFFGGRISVFAEIGVCPICASFEADLIAWDGIRREIPLFDYGLEVRLADLKRIAKQQGVLVPESP